MPDCRKPSLRRMTPSQKTPKEVPGFSGSPTRLLLFPLYSFLLKVRGDAVKAAQRRRIRRLVAQFSSFDGRQGDSDAFVNQSRIRPGDSVGFDSNCPGGKG